MDGLYDLDAEVAVLGSVFLDPVIVDDVLEELAQGDFQADRHGVVLEAMRQCAADSVTVNAVNVVAALRAHGTLERAGGEGAVESLDVYVPANGNWKAYAKIVRDFAVRRRLVAAATNAIADARDSTKKVQDVLGQVEQSIQAVGERATGRGPVRFRDALNVEWKGIEELYERGDKITGITTGIASLDEMTAGLQRTHMIVLAGRPSMGKSALAFNIAVSAAMALKPDEGSVAAFSLEMGQTDLVRRILSSEARVSGNRFRSGQFLEADWPKMANACQRIVGMPLWLDTREALSIHDIRSALRRIKARDKRVALVVIDYLQIMRPDDDAENRTQEVTQLAVGAKRLAKEFDCPVLALSQLNRGLEQRADKRPMMSDLRESGAIEQEADVCAFVYRDDYYNKDSPDAGISEVIIGKQRGGPTGTVRVAFDKEFTLFRDLPEGNRGGF